MFPTAKLKTLAPLVPGSRREGVPRAGRADGPHSLGREIIDLEHAGVASPRAQSDPRAPPRSSQTSTSRS